MSDFFARFEEELIAAGRRRSAPRPRPLRRPWQRRTLLVAIVTLVAAVPVSAVTGVWDESPPEPGGLGAGGAAIPDVGERPCSGPAPARPPASSEPPPAELLDILSVLRRPRTESDRLPATGAPLASGINPDAVRLAREDPGGRRWFLVPAQNVRYRPPVPDTPECERFQEPEVEPRAGVCLVAAGRAGTGGATCTTADLIRKGFSQLTSDHAPGERAGTAHVVGTVPDGVTRVVLEYPRGPQRRVEADVRGNVYTATFNGSAAARPRTFWQTADGLREVAKGPKSTARGRRAARRSRERDRAATATPSVFPTRGGPETIFTMRMRRSGPAYLVTLRGPGGDDCSRSFVERTGATPGRGGLITLIFGPQIAGRSRWCPGTYRGIVEFAPRGMRGLRDRSSRRRVGEFSFRVGER